MKLFAKKIKKIILFSFSFLIIGSVLLFSGCSGEIEQNNNTMTIEEFEASKRELYKKEGYYNRFPIQISIDSSFGSYYINLIKKSLTELDNALEGVKFEYHTSYQGVILQDYSYIFINYDKNGYYDTITSFPETFKDKRYAFATLPAYKYTSKYSTVSTYKSNVYLGSFFMISEDISNSSVIMGWSIKYATYGQFYDFFTTRKNFKNTLINSLKGLVKHEVVHSLGFMGDFSEGCSSKTLNCHSSDKNSLMYPYLDIGSSVYHNKITNDVITYFKNKYPA